MEELFQSALARDLLEELRIEKKRELKRREEGRGKRKEK